MNSRQQLLTLAVTIALLGLSGAGCSDDSNNNSAQTAALCAQLNAKQGQLDCSVAALQVNCNTGDTTCLTNKQNALAQCSSSSSTFTETATAACSALGAGTTSSSTSTSTSSSVTTTPVTAN